MWHDHVYFWKALARCRRVDGDPIACIEAIMGHFESRDINKVVLKNTECQMRAEHRWALDKRPYYDVYPSVTEAFINVDLAKINSAHVALPLKDLLIRFQVGHEFQASPTKKVRSILASDTNAADGGRGLLLAINDGTKELLNDIEVPVHTVRGLVLRDDVSMEELLTRGRDLGDEVDEEAVANVTRLVVALCLLKNNPDLIEPEPLEADRARWEETHDPKLIEKAVKRGTRRWSVGKHIDVAPGFRRPHFAIRWCGKGGIDPQLRPIKGCLVRRKKLEEIPTGYLDE